MFSIVTHGVYDSEGERASTFCLRAANRCCPSEDLTQVSIIGQVSTENISLIQIWATLDGVVDEL